VLAGWCLLLLGGCIYQGSSYYDTPGFSKSQFRYQMERQARVASSAQVVAEKPKTTK
jgi:hypothetical protein